MYFLLRLIGQTAASHLPLFRSNPQSFTPEIKSWNGHQGFVMQLLLWNYTPLVFIKMFHNIWVFLHAVIHGMKACYDASDIPPSDLATHVISKFRDYQCNLGVNHRKVVITLQK